MSLTTLTACSSAISLACSAAADVFVVLVTVVGARSAIKPLPVTWSRLLFTTVGTRTLLYVTSSICWEGWYVPALFL
jgi:hypothetical protein